MSGHREPWFASPETLRELLDAATPRPWYVIGPPWNHDAPWINSLSEDPHVGRFVADVEYPLDDPPNPHRFDDAALIAAAVNALPTLLDVAEAARDCVRDDFADDSYYDRLVAALAALDSANSHSDTVMCSACSGTGEYDWDEIDIFTRCGTCGGRGEIEVCAQCHDSGDECAACSDSANSHSETRP